MVPDPPGGYDVAGTQLQVRSSSASDSVPPFAYVDVFKSHTNVGFFYGAHFDDPAALLEGAGKNMRHVKLKPGREPNPVALENLIHASYLDVKIRLRVE